MAFDGIVIANLVKELQDTLVGGRIVKIAQPEKDELLISIKNYDTYKLLLSADASLPLLYLTNDSKQSPLTAPNFCMLLRKHFNSARILAVTQPGLERIVDFTIEHLDELGDVRQKHLMVELMGKHSNIILCDSENTILDSIKHVSGFVSSVREVLPGRPYFIPQTTEKSDPLTVTETVFCEQILEKPMPLNKALYTSLTGISPLIANELCVRASLAGDMPANTLSENEKLHLYHMFSRMMEQVKEAEFTPNIVYKEKEPVEFSSLSLKTYELGEYETSACASISSILQEYYAKKNAFTRIRQRSADLRRTIQTAIERESKKYDLQLKQLKDTENREKYKVYGELITTYGYSVEQGAKSMQVENFYTGEQVTIPLDESIPVIDNAKRYFDKYSKQKRTFESLTRFAEETKESLIHLESIKNSLEIARKEEDLIQIKEELIAYGYLKKHTVKMKNGKKEKKVKITSKPFHYISSDGYDIYVGKNNFQNDELTFQFATGGDWWFHAKGIAGSHVILKSKGEEIPDRTFEEAAALAAFYSKEKDSDKVEVDYIEKKHVKKPAGAKPGFVVYYTNYSMIAKPQIEHLTELAE